MTPDGCLMSPKASMPRTPSHGTSATPRCAVRTLEGPLGGAAFGVPRREQLQFFGDSVYTRLFEATVRRVEELGGVPVEIDFAPFIEAARLLYEGPWVAERYAAVGRFIDAHPDAAFPSRRRSSVAGRHPPQWKRMRLNTGSRLLNARARPPGRGWI